MKLHLILLVLALLCGCVTSEAGKLFWKLSKAYKPHKEADEDMTVEAIKDEPTSEEPEIMMTGDDDGRPVKPSIMEQQLPKEQANNPHFRYYFTKVSPYGPGWYPTYGGMMFDENRMQEEMDAMREERQKFSHPKFVQWEGVDTKIVDVIYCDNKMLHY